MPGLQGFPDYDDGQPPSLNDFRRLGALAHNLHTLDAGDGAMEAGESGAAYVPPPDTSLWARLTAAGTGSNLGKYSWKQVQDGGTGAAVDVPGGMVGAFDGSTGPPAREVSLATGLTVGSTTGQVVRMWLAESGDFYWFREAAPPTIPAASITVKGVNAGTGDSTSTISGVTEVDFDLATGFTVVSTGLGLAKLQAQPATATHWGAVTHATQNLGGQKHFVPGTGDSTSGVYVQNHATLGSATSVLGFFPDSSGLGYVEAWDQTGAAGSDVLRLAFTPNNSGPTGASRPCFLFQETGGSNRNVALVLGGGDGVTDSRVVVSDSSGTLHLGVSETTPAGKSPIFVGGICVGHTP